MQEAFTTESHFLPHVSVEGMFTDQEKVLSWRRSIFLRIKDNGILNSERKTNKQKQIQKKKQMICLGRLTIVFSGSLGKFHPSPFPYVIPKDLKISRSQTLIRPSTLTILHGLNDETQAWSRAAVSQEFRWWCLTEVPDPESLLGGETWLQVSNLQLRVPMTANMSVLVATRRLWCSENHILTLLCSETESQEEVLDWVVCMKKETSPSSTRKKQLFLKAVQKICSLK